MVFDDGFECPHGPTVVQLDGINFRCIEGNRILLLRLLNDEQEFGLRIDEALDQPGASNAINLDVLPCNSFHVLPHGRQEYVNLIAKRFS
jgi:hypothetical protein